MADLLKFITCGSVDDGKSTLIGHMLYDAKLLFADQKQALELESKVGSRGGEIDYSLLLDGLMAEREQGITIDVAYRYFTTDHRAFIVADTPGHEEYTRNMAVGASFADLAVILLDARKGILVQTRRHARICALMGIRYYCFAVNKMDLVSWDQPRFREIEDQLKALAEELKLEHIIVIPVSATEGDNVTTLSGHMPWYQGPALLSYLEEVNVDGVSTGRVYTDRDNVDKVNIDSENIDKDNADKANTDNTNIGRNNTDKGNTDIADIEEESSQNAEEGEGFIMPVQRVCRPNSSFRGFEGQVEAGSLAVGEPILVLPSREEAIVRQILVAGKDSQTARCGMPVTLVPDREIDVSRGCVIEKADRRNLAQEKSGYVSPGKGNRNIRQRGLKVANLFQAELLWTDDQPLHEGKSFLLKLGTKELPASVMEIKYKTDINTGMKLAASGLTKNEIAVCDIAVSQRIVLAPFEENRTLGSFILIDRVSNQTAACGVVRHILRRSDNVVWQDTEITRQLRADHMGQKPMTLWFTGLSGSGKSTIADALEKKLYAQGYYTMLLDGDNIRMGLNKNLGFEPEDRIENIRRVAEVAKLMNDAGLIVLVSFISPYRLDRDKARKIIGRDHFVEIYVDTPLEECEKRDVKGLYRKAREGKIPNFTGISSPYEAPVDPELILHTEGTTPEECAEQIFDYLNDTFYQ